MPPARDVTCEETGVQTADASPGPIPNAYINASLQGPFSREHLQTGGVGEVGERGYTAWPAYQAMGAIFQNSRVLPTYRAWFRLPHRLHGRKRQSYVGAGDSNVSVLMAGHSLPWRAANAVTRHSRSMRLATSQRRMCHRNEDTEMVNNSVLHRGLHTGSGNG